MALRGNARPPPPEAGPGQDPPSEADLAALLSDVHGGDCWLLLATGGEDAESQERMAERALDLYRRAAPGLGGDVETWGTPPAVGAAGAGARARGHPPRSAA